MVTTDLGACEWFVWDLRRSNLLDRGQLDQVVGEFLSKNPQAEPPVLAEYLVGQRILTQFQVDRLLNGKTQGFVLGPYTLMDALGTGSMGTVYKAKSKTDNKWYAVKVLPRRSMWNVRIARRKVRAFEQCRHPSVVPFVDVGTAGGMHYLSWPLAEGETLDKVVTREGKLRPGLAASFALQAAEGLDSCHQQGLFHGLFKPSNLMITPDQHVRILDLGIGSLLAETEGESLVDTMSTANSIASGLDCASPESVMDPTNLTPLGDQYSLGCTLYYCLSGRYPFPDGTTAEKMMAHQFKQPTPLKELAPELPDELVAVVERLMQKSPEARYGGTADVVAALKPFAEKVVSSHAADAPRTTKRPGSRPEVSLEQTPPPSQRPQGIPSRTSVPQVPTRQSLRGSPSKQSQDASSPPGAGGSNPNSGSKEHAPVVEEVSAKKGPRVLPKQPVMEEPKLNWEERLGPTGVAISAIILCALAWLLTWKLF
jgi:serine/threonine protein kinase